MSSSTANTISVQCTCGKKLKAPSTAVGRKAKCPNCGNVMTVTAQPPPPPPPAAATRGGEEYDPLYDLAEQAHASSAAEPQQTICPNCRSAMTAGAILCTSCGYDTRTGQTLSTTLASAPPAPAPPPTTRGTPFPAAAHPPGLRTSVATTVDTGERGAYIRGTIISGICAVIGAFIWFGIAKGIEREIGWVAWGIGLFAGFGMMVGANGNTPTAGMIAAAMAVGGIVLGKIMVFVFVVMPMFNSMLDKTLGGISDADKLEVWVGRQQMEKKNIDIENATDAQRKTANTEAKQLIAKMDAKTKAAKQKEANDSFSQIMGEAADAIPKSRIFFSTMFGPLDVLFFILAIASAFKVATFGGENSE